jgi:16S rRNA (cytosine1402-N4)-methyltransferase
LFTVNFLPEMTPETDQSKQRHVPVMLDEVLAALEPRDDAIYVDGTFGAGGYSRAILEAADCRVVGIDRDPSAIAAGQAMVSEFAGRLTLVEGRFGSMAQHLSDLGLGHVQGVVLDVGVSSMQLDEAARGFSFMREGPLDMRMSRSGKSAADIVNTYAPELLAKVIFLFGEEPRSRAIASAIVAQRLFAPIVTTIDLVKAIERATGPQRAKDRTHPATRTFQALRIYVNAELEELADALHEAEKILDVEGKLVVVSFHSLEDRIVKRFLAMRAGKTPEVSRHMPGAVEHPLPSFELPFTGHVDPAEAESARNPRARSAKLRAASRTSASAWPDSRNDLGIPRVERSRH